MVRSTRPRGARAADLGQSGRGLRGDGLDVLTCSGAGGPTFVPVGSPSAAPAVTIPNVRNGDSAYDAFGPGVRFALGLVVVLATCSIPPLAAAAQSVDLEVGDSVRVRIVRVPREFPPGCGLPGILYAGVVVQLVSGPLEHRARFVLALRCASDGRRTERGFAIRRGDVLRVTIGGACTGADCAGGRLFNSFTEPSQVFYASSARVL